MLLKNARFVLTPTHVLENHSILIDKGTIVKVGKDIDNKEDIDGVEIDARNKLVMPGLVNTHTHSAMTLFRGAGDDMKLTEWLENKIWPMESRLKERDVYWGSMLACIEMVKSGTTTFCDMYFFMDAVAEASEKIGLRSVLSWAIIDKELTTQKGDPVSNCESFIKRWKNTELIKPSAGPHSIYTCSDETLIRTKEIVEKYGSLIHIHLSETKNEMDTSIKRFGKNPVNYLEDINFLNENVLAAHCVWLDKKDIMILKNKGVKVSHCPVSNMKLASGIAPIPQMLKNGLNVSLGTDGACSNNSLDMFETIKFTALIHKINNMDPTILKAEDVLRMSTEEGGLSLGLNIGKIEVGFKADIIILNINKPNWKPVYNPISNIVYSAKGGDVETVIIDGRVVFENNEMKTIDEIEVMEKVEKIRDKFM